MLTASVDMDAIACAAPNGTDTVNVRSAGYGTCSVNLSALSPRGEEAGTTAALVRGVLAGVADRGYPVAGFDALIVSDVPGGSGLSSSACFETLLGVALNDLFCGGALTTVDIAKIGQYAENVYFSKPSGLLDQMGCATGGIIAIDFADSANPAVHPVRFDFAGAGHALCVIDSGGSHADLTGYYASIPAEMRAVARELGAETLSGVDEDAFRRSVPELRGRVGDRAVLRALHYFAECRRVREQVDALERGDFHRFLELVNESGRSSFMYLQNVCTYSDPEHEPVAVTLALAERLLNGRGACRVHGGGFAGTVLAIVPLDMVDSFSQNFGSACRVTSVRPAGGRVLF